MTETIMYTLDQREAVAKKLKGLLAICKVITLTGPLGAGKTTIVKELLRQCGVAERVTSPTFTYLNQYKNQSGQTFYHFDLYRIGSLQDFLSAGFDEYLYAPDSWVLIEWPEYVLPLLKKEVCHIVIDYNQDLDKRMMSLEVK
jgi:ATPase, YjeE family